MYIIIEIKKQVVETVTNYIVEKNYKLFLAAFLAELKSATPTVAEFE